MKKTKYFLIGFLLIGMFAFTTTVRASDYEVGVAEDDEYRWQVSTVDKDAWKDAMGEEYDEDSRGKESANYKIQITKIETKDDEATITYDMWNFTEDSFGDEPDDKDNTADLTLNKDNITQGDAYAIFYGWIIPTPSVEYLEAAIDVMNNTKASLDETTVTYDATNYTVEVSYGDNGILSSQKYMNSDEEIFYEVKLSTSIPGYEIPVLLGITGIFSIGLIYTIMKRK